ncbi:MAG TPA: MATE family efflux transporter [Verrucomicrobiae bacterium]|nr:MATE family efflux transporter [Verrucomicrobiae bacterium]
MQSEIAVIESKSFLELLKRAVAGERKDFTSGSIKQALFMLAVPMILEMIMESLFAVVDVFYVSRVGVNAVATVGLTESVMMIIYAIAIGLSMAATAFVARRAGEKNFKAAAEAGMQALLLAVLITIPLSLTGIIFAGDILHLMGASPAVIAEGKTYARIQLGGHIIVMFLFLNNAVFRGVGDASIAMRVLWLANILNMLLGPVFIFGLGPVPALGVTGAAVATSLGRGIGVLFQFRNLTTDRSLIRVRLENIRFDFPLMRQMFRVALGGMSQFLIGSASWIFMVRILSTFGSSAVAGYTIAFRTIVFTILPSWGLANAAATLVGQNLGAKQPDRAEKSVWTAAYYNMLFLTAVSVLFFILAGRILNIYSSDPEVIRTGVFCLRIICLGYIFYAYGMVIGQAFNGAGDTRTPTHLNLFCFWLIQIPAAYFLAKVLMLGPAGVFSAQAFSFSLSAILAVLIFRRGKWKMVKV